MNRSIVRTVDPRQLATALLAALVATACGCRSPDGRKAIEPVYDKATGRLQLLKYDANGNGRVDTWSYMDGARIVRIEADQDEDGKTDRWEYYGPEGRLQKVGLSRANDGKPDSWMYGEANRAASRIEISTQHDDKVDRVEYFENGAMVRAEEDTDRDGDVDKWETYAGSRLTSVAFDLTHSGHPERRLLYGADGSVRIEIDRAGDGQFRPIDSDTASRAVGNDRRRGGL